MVSIYELKPKFQQLLRPLVRGLAKIGVTANFVTISAAVLSVALGILLLLYPSYNWIILLVPAFLFFRMMLNAIDGMLAREHKMESSLGSILNELGDIVSDAAIYLPFALILDTSSAFVVSLVVLALVTEVTGILGTVIGGSRRYDGPMGKSDRAFAFGVLSLLIYFFSFPTVIYTIVIAALLLLLILTTFNRANRALKEVQS
ncbi:CDP-alcohol phosphatidyltransferase family protein [Salicibibacter cibi]|uniref:CDP-alcohol phosphatidyltransferase family protein n=1 Tax=Salicibibacter cibi TaxID=2743001 RepID=A0A7T6ZAZ7_9BACI|nr:CDP-alcohol phosphatidyltransferase family protein [Salicibibacter cibi]QQK80022.1 CDP-alcohol phosphatidyltransferase family protein [Salicibibacter cibi]